MTLDEAIEVLGGLVSAAGGEGDNALDVVKDAFGLLREARDLKATRDWPIGRHFRWAADVEQVLGPRA